MRLYLACLSWLLWVSPPCRPAPADQVPPMAAHRALYALTLQQARGAEVSGRAGRWRMRCSTPAMAGQRGNGWR